MKIALKNGRFEQKIANVCEKLEFWRNFENWCKGLQNFSDSAAYLCRCWKSLKNSSFLANVAVHTAENAPLKIWEVIQFNTHSPPICGEESRNATVSTWRALLRQAQHPSGCFEKSAEGPSSLRKKNRSQPARNALLLTPAKNEKSDWAGSPLSKTVCKNCLP